MQKYINLITNVGIFALSNIALKLMTFLLVPLYTYYLSTAEYGLTDMLTTVLNIAMPLLTVSISDGVLRYCIESDGERHSQVEYVSAGFIVNAASCILAAALIPFLDMSVFGGLGMYKQWYMLCYVLLTFNTYHSNVARGLNQMRLIAISSILTSAVNIIVAVALFAVAHCGIYAFFISTAAGYLAGIVLYVVRGKHLSYLSFRQVKRATYLDLLTYSLPLVPNTLFWWAAQSINRFFITGVLGIAASGLFAAASKLSSFLNLVSSIFQQAWNISAFQEREGEDRTHFFNSVFPIYLLLLICCCGLLIPFTPLVSSIVLQKQFYMSWRLTPVLIIAFLFSSLNAFWGSIYTACLKTGQLFVTTMWGAIACVLLNWWFIPMFGLQGACLATAISNTIVWLARVIDSRRIMKIHVRWLQVIAEITLLALSSVALIRLERYSVGVSLVFGMMAIGIQAFSARNSIRSVVANIPMLRKDEKNA